MSEFKNVVVITIGTRDIVFKNNELFDLKQLEGTILSHGKIMPRRGGKLLLQNFEQYAEQLDYPIVHKALAYIKRKVDCVDKLFLVSTDQSNELEVLERFKQNDTVFCAKVLEQLIYKEQEKLANKPIKDIKHITVQNRVSEIDQMFAYWKNIFLSSDSKKYKALSDNEKLFLVPVGGIDAINTALLITAIMNRKEACSQIYVSEDSNMPAVELDFGSQLIREINREKALYFLDRFDYASLEKCFNTDFEVDRMLMRLSLYAKHRLYFNLEEAKRIAEEVAKDYDRVLGIRMIKEIDILEQDEETKMKELFFNALTKLKQEQYVDFLLRIYRLEESIYRHYVEKYLKINTTKGKNLFEDFEDGINAFKPLAFYLSTKKVDGKPLEIKKPNNINLGYMFDYIIDENREKSDEMILSAIDQERLRQLRIQVKKLSKLSNMRNKSIAAHGFEGVSKEKIQNELDADIYEFMESLNEAIEIKYEENIYHYINDVIEKQFRKSQKNV